MADESVIDKGVALWSQFKEDQPELAFALSVIPVSGQVAAAAEYYDAMKRGDSGDAILSALQFIPVVGKGMRGLAGLEVAGQETRKLAPELAQFGNARIGRNGESLSDFFNAASVRAEASGKEVVSGAASAAANLYDYMKGKLTEQKRAADDAMQLGFNQVRGFTK